MTISIDSPAGDDDLREFITFADSINRDRSAWWPALEVMQLPFLKGESADAQGRTMRPFVARDGRAIVAQALAVDDARYRAHWNEPLGHVSMFEALPDTVGAVRALMDEACGWLRSRGLTAARAGFGSGGDYPFRIDDDDSLPPVMLRQNPSYYHTLLKEAGFESERGWVDYRAEITPENEDRWEHMLEAANARGFRIVPYGDVPKDVRARQFVDVWNDAFRSHWGICPQTYAEHEESAEFLLGAGMGETSVIAYDGDEPVGALWVVPELASQLSAHARPLRGEERVNFLAIAVRERARGTGVNLAMAAYAYLRLVERGATHVSYTLVLDDNWPSRRTAEKLGASICANYAVYRRNFVRTTA